MPAGSPSASRSPQEKSKDTEKWVKHTVDARTIQFVTCMLDLPIRFHPSREYAKTYSHGEMQDAIEAMSECDSMENLDKYIEAVEAGLKQAGLLRDQFKEVAKSLKGSVTNDGRAIVRNAQQAQQRIVVVSFCVCVHVFSDWLIIIHVYFLFEFVCLEDSYGCVVQAQGGNCQSSRIDQRAGARGSLHVPFALE